MANIEEGLSLYDNTKVAKNKQGYAGNALVKPLCTIFHYTNFLTLALG